MHRGSPRKSIESTGGTRGGGRERIEGIRTVGIGGGESRVANNAWHGKGCAWKGSA